MRLPKPKSAPGILLYTITAAAALLLARILWVLIGQNVETVSAEKGYDKLLSRHWTEIMDWLGQNGFWLSLATAAFLGGTVALWAYIALQAKDASPPSPEPGSLLPEEPAKSVHEKYNIQIAMGRSAKSAGFALGEGSAKAAELALPGITSTLLSIKKHYGLPIPALDAVRARENVEAAAKYLIEIAPLLNGGHIDEAREKAAQLVSPPPAPIYKPVTPAPTPAQREEFNYPYRKAVLQAEFPPGSRSGDGKGRIIGASYPIRVRNEHSALLRNCCAFLVALTEGSHRREIGSPLTVARDRQTKELTGQFDVAPSSPKQWTFVIRDMLDQVSKPPFLLRVVSGDIPLKGNERYILELELRSAYPHPTKLGVQLDTAEEGIVRVTLLDQSV